jgi:hypothetical protein
MKKFIVWGHKYNNHSHANIHYAYKRAFESMGWETYWLDNADDVSAFDFSGSLFLTEGQVDGNIPIRPDCKYILHNCDTTKYGDNFIILQVYTTDVLTRNVEKIEDCIYFQSEIKTLYQPWATDYLPNEIENLTSLNFSNNKVVNWVGSVWEGGGYGNLNEIKILKESLKKYDIDFKEIRTPYQENKIHINSSYISPSIQGAWQVEKSYIPCRIFKNISYGEFGITNSQGVYDLLEQQIIFDNDINVLIDKAITHRELITLSQINSQINLVRNKHTYINRITNILNLI